MVRGLSEGGGGACGIDAGAMARLVRQLGLQAEVCTWWGVLKVTSRMLGWYEVEGVCYEPGSG